MERYSAALTGDSVERSDRLTKPRATDIASAAEIISRIGVLFMKGAQRELVDVNELLQEMIVLPRTQAVLPLQTAAPRRLTQFFCGIGGLLTSASRLGLRGSSSRLLYTDNRSLTHAYWVVLMAGMTIAQDNSSQHPSARQQLQHIHEPQSIEQELAHLTKS